MDSVLSNEVARRIAADLTTLVSEAEKHGTLPRIKSVAIYFNETELRTIIKLLRSCHGILDPAQHASGQDDHRVFFACECCLEHEPESGVYHRSDIGVMPDGTWLCDNCYSDCDKSAYGMVAHDIDDFEFPRFEDLPRPATAALIPAGGGDPELMIVGDNDSAGVVPYSANEALAEIDRLREELSQARALVEKLKAFAESFHVTVCDNFYKDASLTLERPHSLSIRLRNDSSKSWIFADLEARRRDALSHPSTMLKPPAECPECGLTLGHTSACTHGREPPPDDSRLSGFHP